MTTVTIHRQRVNRAYSTDEMQANGWVAGACPEYNDRNYDFECVEERELIIPAGYEAFDGRVGDTCLRAPSGAIYLLTEALTEAGTVADWAV